MNEVVNMTHKEQIFFAVALLVSGHKKPVFTRAEIRHLIGVSSAEWNAGYDPIFQGMRSDQPGGAPNVGDRYKNVFRQVKYGKHELTKDGLELLRKLIA